MKLRAALGVVALLGLLAACGPGKFADETAPRSEGGTVSTSEAPPSSAAIIPTGIRIPSIGLDNRDFMQVGLNPDKSLEVPPLNMPHLIGWYRDSPVPGDAPMCTFDAGCPQPGVLASHINGDGVQGGFAKLAQVKVGAVVEVDRSDGETAVFKVTKRLVFDKAKFDTRTVYSAAPPSLVLVTCGPEGYDAKARSYRQQTVLIATRTEMRPTGQ